MVRLIYNLSDYSDIEVNDYLEIALRYSGFKRKPNDRFLFVFVPREELSVKEREPYPLFIEELEQAPFYQSQQDRNSRSFALTPPVEFSSDSQLPIDYYLNKARQVYPHKANEGSLDDQAREVFDKPRDVFDEVIPQLDNANKNKTIYFLCDVKTKGWVLVSIQLSLVSEEDATNQATIKLTSFRQMSEEVLNRLSVCLSEKMQARLNNCIVTTQYETINTDGKNQLTGVLAVEYLMCILTGASFSSDIQYLKQKHISLMLDYYARYREVEKNKRESHYTITNFLANHTTLTRSLVVNRQLQQLLLDAQTYEKTGFVFVQHFIPQTVELVRALIYRGADPENIIFLRDKIYSSERGVPNISPSIADRLRRLGAHVFEADLKKYQGNRKFHEVFTEELNDGFARARIIFGEKIKQNKITLVQLYDDGGRAILLYQKMLNENDSPFPNVSVVAGEQTTAGVDLLAKQLLDDKTFNFPIVMMAPSTVKRMTEASLIGDQFAYKLIELLKEFSDDIRIGINGYGKIGQQITLFLMKKLDALNLDYELYIHEPSKENGRRLQRDAILKPRIKICHSLYHLVLKTNFFIGATGRNAFEEQGVNLEKLFSEIQEEKHFLSSSSENIEFLFILLFLNELLKEQNTSVRRNVTEFPLDDVIYQINGNRCVFHYGGYPFNFSGGKPGVDFQNIQGTLSSILDCIFQGSQLAVSPTKPYLNPLVVYAPSRQCNTMVNLISAKPFFRKDVAKSRVKFFEDFKKVAADSFYDRREESYSGKSIKRYGCVDEVSQKIISLSIKEIYFMLQEDKQTKEIRWNLPIIERFFVERPILRCEIETFLKQEVQCAPKKLVLFGELGTGNTFLAMIYAIEGKLDKATKYIRFLDDNNSYLKGTTYAGNYTGMWLSKISQVTPSSLLISFFFDMTCKQYVEKYGSAPGV